ncbi:GNAT family N-acetyltransferase [Chitinophaga nivalis]|uniref:GNAT family N-acetyltransferase n=1 Tax=Chitinophaga nivalis TaxID=2991709 RepID=A0ABT3IQD3_9BACT|nr:GNAT family N-acetyltransferase [Chitinophaga nivalis]MCW3464167.1 GNAT family N-acetyltransferase [Chitinophaga nivalis]MCW3486143.1 GNAT family N-acetyltransferase [Chitinophaga nivalis]
MAYTIYLLEDPRQLTAVVDFFIAHKTNTYISHGEITGGRADDPNNWNKDLAAILTAQYSKAFEQQAHEALRILIAADDTGTILGIAAFNIIYTPRKNYAILEDMIIAQAARGQSLGSKILAFAQQADFLQDAAFILLESGIHNEQAHHFFEKNGFEKVSVNYLKKLK